MPVMEADLAVLKAELKAELAEELTRELRAQITAEVRAELKAELRRPKDDYASLWCASPVDDVPAPAPEPVPPAAPAVVVAPAVDAEEVSCKSETKDAAADVELARDDNPIERKTSLGRQLSKKLSSIARVDPDDIEEEVSIEESIWDTPLIIGSDAVPPAASAYVLLLLLINIGVQLVFCGIVYEMAAPSITRDTVQQLRRWRRNVAHNIDFYDSISAQSIAQRVCAKDTAVETSANQMVRRARRKRARRGRPVAPARARYIRARARGRAGDVHDARTVPRSERLAPARPAHVLSRALRLGAHGVEGAHRGRPHLARGLPRARRAHDTA